MPIDCATIWRRFENASRYSRAGAAVGAGVALGEVRDRGEEVAERFDRHVPDGTEVLPRAHELVFGRGVLGAFVDRQLDPDERDAGRRADAVGDGLLEAVAVADAAEVGEQQVGDGVVGSFERRGEAEPFVVLGEQRAAQDAAAETVTLVGDEQTAAAVRAAPACTRRPSGGSRRARRTTRVVLAAVAQAPDARVRAARRSAGRATAPSARATERRRARSGRGGNASVGGRDRDVGLARAGDRLDHARDGRTATS